MNLWSGTHNACSAFTQDTCHRLREADGSGVRM